MTPGSLRACLTRPSNLGGSIGVAVASTVAATHSHALARLGDGGSAALAGGFVWALWVCGLTALVAVPLAFVLIRRADRTPVVSAAIS
jgi:hypothetical protein